MSRRKIERENDEFAGMLIRLLKAYGKRVGEADEVDLRDMVEVGKVFDEQLQAAVDRQRERGYSWAQIAEGLGVKRQTAWERFGRSRDAAVS